MYKKVLYVQEPFFPHSALFATSLTQRVVGSANSELLTALLNGQYGMPNVLPTSLGVAAETFVAKGLSIAARNYMEVYIYDKWSDRTLPDYAAQTPATPRPSSRAYPSTIPLKDLSTQHIWLPCISTHTHTPLSRGYVRRPPPPRRGSALPRGTPSCRRA